jgi:imidazolonepropionase-like amidohydrolase
MRLRDDPEQAEQDSAAIRRSDCARLVCILMRRLAACFFLTCLMAIADEPSAMAIRNARIVTVSGPVIAKGTVVVRKGLIESVGENVTVPADAWIVEGDGLTVYPGLIDALSTVGIPTTATPAPAAAANAAAAPAAAAATAARSNGPEDRPRTTSWALAADEIVATDRRIALVRGAGITTTATFPERGIFGGQGALIDLLTDEKPSRMVVISPLGQYASLTLAGRGGGFPGALMGVIAYIRQIYLDLDHYQAVKADYDRDPRGKQRPEYDRALEGIAASKRLLLPANRLVEIDRMVRFGAELKQNTVLYGGLEAYRPEAAALLKKYNTPLLVSLKFPVRAADSDPDEPGILRVLEQRDKAPSAPAELQKAGVKFALYADGIEQPRDFQRAVKKAIDAGLPREAALRALTLTPAEIYGVADRVGSIEKGKIANLVVTKGDLFEDATTVQMIFVDGHKYEPQLPPVGPAGASGGGRGGRGGPGRK